MRKWELLRRRAWWARWRWTRRWTRLWMTVSVPVGTRRRPGPVVDNILWTGPGMVRCRASGAMLGWTGVGMVRCGLWRGRRGETRRPGITTAPGGTVSPSACGVPTSSRSVWPRRRDQYVRREDLEVATVLRAQPAPDTRAGRRRLINAFNATLRGFTSGTPVARESGLGLRLGRGPPTTADCGVR
jgi:hypothetical protein